MRAVYFLTLRQLSGKWRLAIMLVLASMPVLLTLLFIATNNTPSVVEFENTMLGAMLTGAIAPLAVLAIAAPAFGNEVEDRTLANLTITSMPRWQIVLPKFLGTLTVASPVV